MCFHLVSIYLSAARPSPAIIELIAKEAHAVPTDTAVLYAPAESGYVSLSPLERY